MWGLVNTVAGSLRAGSVGLAPQKRAGSPATVLSMGGASYPATGLPCQMFAIVAQFANM